MAERPDQHHSERGRSPIRQQSAIGGTTTGWRSSLETTPRKSFGAFVGELLLAAGVFVGLVFLLVWLS